MNTSDKNEEIFTHMWLAFIHGRQQRDGKQEVLHPLSFEYNAFHLVSRRLRRAAFQAGRQTKFIFPYSSPCFPLFISMPGSLLQYAIIK